MPMMDVNITHAIAANVTLTQSSLNPTLITALIAFFGGAIVACIGAYVAYRTNKKMIDANFEITEKNIKLEKFNEKRQAHCNLFGCKHTILQYYESYLVSIINAENSILNSKLIAIGKIDFEPVKVLLENNNVEAANQYTNRKLEANLRNSFDLEEGLRIRKSIADLALQLGKADERFWRIIGKIKTLFPDTKVMDLVKEVKEAEMDLENSGKIINDTFQKTNIEITEGCHSISSNEKRITFFNEKKKKKDSEVNSSLITARNKRDNLEFKIDDLLNHLEDCLKSEK